MKLHSARFLLACLTSASMLATSAFAQAPAPATAPVDNFPAVAAQTKPFAYVPAESDIVIGVPSAKVTIVEYASLSCPHCAHFHNDVLPELKKKYIEPGDVRVVFRHFPLNASALTGSIAINCVSDNERQKYLKVLFAAQDKWAFDSNYKEALAGIVSVGGLTKARFEACQNDKKMEEAVLLVRKEAGENKWVNSTPTFYINNIEYKGAKNVVEFSSAIDALLK